MQTETIPS